MDEVAKLLNGLLGAGIIRDYAVFGAVAQMRYTEPLATLDADILVILPDEGRLDLLTPIYEYCSERGYHAKGEAIQVGNWPVQFIPVFDGLSKAALEEAEMGEIDGIPLKVISAVYLVLLALNVGRSKDHMRIISMIESGAVTFDEIEKLSNQSGLLDKWDLFKSRFLND